MTRRSPPLSDGAPPDAHLVGDAPRLQTSAAAVLTPTFDVDTPIEKARVHSSWAIAVVAAAGFVFFCGAVVYHGIVGEWPMGAVFRTADAQR